MVLEHLYASCVMHSRLRMCCECVQLAHYASKRRSANQLGKSQDHEQACLADVSISHHLHSTIALNSVSCNMMPIHLTKGTECQTCLVALQSKNTCPSSSCLLGFWESAFLFQFLLLFLCRKFIFQQNFCMFWLKTGSWKLKPHI